MLHDRRTHDAALRVRNLAYEEPQRRIEIEQVVIRERFASELLGQTVRAREVERGPRLWVLTVTKRRCERNRERERAREFACDQARLEIPRDRRIVLRRALEGARREAPPQRDIRFATRLANRRILIGVHENRHVREVFRRGTNQRDAADIDLLDRLLQRRAFTRDG